MDGPFNLTQGNINKVNQRSGAYILGGKSAHGKYWGCYAGRSDDDISERLQYWLDLINGARELVNHTDRCILRRRPDLYWRSHTTTAKAAYNEECRLYHEGYSCNAIHPAKSNNAWNCPICSE
jgi:hypothetical protein